MNNIYFTLAYLGGITQVEIKPEENVLGLLYPVIMDDNYAFTTYMDEDEEWKIMREQDGSTPLVENELWKLIIKKLSYAIRYAA